MMENEQLVQVLSILVQAAEVGQKAGAYDLASAGVISQAVGLAKTDIEAKAKEAEANKAEAPIMEVKDKK